eukprot:508032_1
MIILSCFTLFLFSFVFIGESLFPCSTINECKNQILWHIPGPNPIVSPYSSNSKNNWASVKCEVAGGAYKVNNTYYLIYHCTGNSNIYSIGLSTSNNPLGYWSKPANQPIFSANKTTNYWDNNDVASFNILQNPTTNNSSSWLGYFEGGFGDGTDGKWSLGLALSNNGPLGPWKEYNNNPILIGNNTCIDLTNESFDGKTCNGLYVASVLYINKLNEYWLYCEAPINENDQGPIQLWIANDMKGPFIFKDYVLTVPQNRNENNLWNSGKYSESKIMFFNGMYHSFLTASNIGNPNPNKIHESIGWAFSMNGINFTENKYNAIAWYNETTPFTDAMAEGHVFMEQENDLIYVYHTIRWSNYTNISSFAPYGRNNEDLGVEIFSTNKKFEIFDFPIIDENWELKLIKNEESKCLYDSINYRYCSQLKTTISNSNGDDNTVINPQLSFNVNVNNCVSGSFVNVSVNIYVFDVVNDAKGNKLISWKLNGFCDNNN